MCNLDSRFLCFQATYSQSFLRAGRYNCGFYLPIFNQLNPAESASFIINVKEADDRERKGQHFLIVREVEGQLAAEPSELNIMTGEVVTFYTPDQTTQSFCISGRSETDSFSSAAMTRGALYTYAFDREGEYEWGDANGNSVKGKVIVSAMPQLKTAREIESYRARIGEGVMVQIKGGQVEPSIVKVQPGGTVFFVVEEASEITITDKTLLDLREAEPSFPIRSEGFPVEIREGTSTLHAIKESSR